VFDSHHAPVAVSPALEQVLRPLYGEPHRASHDARHIADVLRWYDWVAERAGWDAPADVYFAIVCHDAIYDPLAKDNEARSAELARRHGASERTQQLILLTARHGQLSPEDVDRDEAHFLDCDTAILGAPPGTYDAYEAAIAAEYAQVPADAFRAGRRQFLSGMLARPRIFLSDLFHAELDARARDNLARALARL
jgi:predicted metal-dependent HD superfamily phosphohydrolase